MNRNRLFQLPVLLLGLFTLGGCDSIGGISLSGSGNVVTVNQDFSDFNRVEVGYGCRLRLNQGETHSVVIRVDDNLREHLQVEKEASTLKIGLRRGYGYFRKTLEADITMPDLEALGLSGGSRGEVSGFEFNHDLELGLSGGSQLRAALSPGNLQLSLSGGSKAELLGQGKDVKVDGSGGSEAELAEFGALNVDASLSGGSSAAVSLQGDLTGELSGGSEVYYAGKPARISVSKSGGARVVAR